MYYLDLECNGFVKIVYSMSVSWSQGCWWVDRGYAVVCTEA